MRTSNELAQAKMDPAADSNFVKRVGIFVK